MGSSSPTNAGEEERATYPRRRKPKSLPPMTNKPKSPLVSAARDVKEMRRFIGSPPPSALKGRDLSSSTELLVGLDSIDMSSPVSGEEYSGDEAEEKMMYDPEFANFDSTQPKIMLQPAPRESTPTTHQAILAASASSLSIQSIVSAASSVLSNELTPPPKLLTYQGTSSAEAVQEWVPEDMNDGRDHRRRASTPSIRDLPSPLEGCSPLHHRRMESHTQKRRSRSVIKLEPLRKT